jgi:competence protein ComEA
MAVVAVVTVFLAGGWVLAARPHRLAAASSLPASPEPSARTSTGRPAEIVPGGSLQSPLAGSSAAGSPSRSAAGTELVVDVVGKVRRPGVYRLSAGARVNDAVTSAGGLLPGVDLASVNLARKLSDGEQLLVGLVAPGAAPASTGPGSGGSASGGSGNSDSSAGSADSSTPVDLNSATLTQLDGLPGVGPVLAQRILDWRTQHGRFDSVDQLRGVTGIGDVKFADLKSLVSVG